MSELWIIVLFILLAIFGLLCYSGLLEGVEISVGAPPIPGVTVAYKFAKGPYRNAGRIFGEVARLTPKLKPVGINFDNPNLVTIVLKLKMFRLNMHCILSFQIKLKL